MIVEVITAGRKDMARRTIFIPDAVEARARAAAEPGESFSATVTRLIELGAAAAGDPAPPSYIASGEGPEDLGRWAERYLADLGAES